MKQELHKWNSGNQHFAVALVLILATAGLGQAVTATVPVGANPTAIAVNPTTNKIYVANCPEGSSRTVGINGTITVINGDTNTTETVEAGLCPTAVAVNPTTNKIYVANFGHISVYCGSCFDYGSVTVIDGETNATTTVNGPGAKFPHAVAINPITNKIFVANNDNNSAGIVTLIDGASNSITSVPVGSWPYDVAVNPVTNKIYVTSFGPIAFEAQTSVSVIDGTTDKTTVVMDPSAVDPIAVAVNSSTNKIYVANVGDLGKNGTNVGSITVIDGATGSTKNIVDPNAVAPSAVAVNSATDKIYISNLNDTAGSGHGGVTVIDGATNSSTTVTDPTAACDSFGHANLAVEPAMDKVYVANCKSNNVTVIDGATKSTTTIADPNAVTPIAVAVNPRTHKAYVANSGSNNVTVVDATMIDAQPDFSLSPASASLAVQPGGQGSDIITVAPRNGSFGTPVQLTCAITGPAPTPTCALSPASVKPGANSVTSTLTITASATAAMQLPFSRPQLSRSLYAVGLPLMFGIGLVGGSKTKHRRYWVFYGLLLLLLVLQAACGGSNNSTGAGTGTPSPTNYTVTVAGASGAIEHTTQVAVTVQ
jgi:YVTN family beta-propeller protein